MGTKRGANDTGTLGTGSSDAREREIAEGEVLYEIGESSAAAYFVRSGEIDLLSPGSGGSYRLTERVGPGACAGGVDVLTRRERTLQARAASELRVVEVGADVFRSMCSERPQIALRLLEQQAVRTDDLERRLGAVGADDLVRPIAFALLAAAEAAERGMRVTTTLRELSTQSGLSLRQTHRGLQELFEAKQVRLHDDALWIPEPDALRGHLEGTPLVDALAN